MQDLSYAVKEKVVEDHNVIDEAIRDEAEGYTVFSIPVGVVYRPNEAKVRNLKTKDYLGKARLVAASDRANAFTGFAGSEIKNVSYPLCAATGSCCARRSNTRLQASGVRGDVKDDRPTDNISFAATNLVKTDIQSRRLQSEPPVGRNVFPPTPPPENDKPSGVNRGASVRNGPRPMPAKLNIDKARPNDRYEKAGSPQDARARPQRANSTAAPSRGYSQRAPPRRGGGEEEDAYPDELYDMYQGGGGTRASRSQQGGRRVQPQRYIEEEEEGSDYDDGSFDEGDFEIVGGRRPGTNSMSGSSRGQSRRPEIRKIRVKVHADDVRYLMIGTAIEFPDLVDRIRDKFAIRRRFKIKVRDDDAPNSEMITMGDQDDLEMVIMGVKTQARRQRLDIGKMEVSAPGPGYDGSLFC